MLTESCFRAEHRGGDSLQSHMWRFPCPLRGRAVCCSQLSCQHLVIYGRLVGQPGKQWVVGLPETFFLVSSMRDGDQTSKLSICLMTGILHGWISPCSYNFRDATVLVMRSAIPSASWLVSSPVTRSHSSFGIFYFSIFRVWTTNSALFYTVFYTISFIVFVSGAQIVTAWGVRRFWSHSLSIAHHL